MVKRARRELDASEKKALQEYADSLKQRKNKQQQPARPAPVVAARPVRRTGTAAASPKPKAKAKAVSSKPKPKSKANGSSRKSSAPPRSPNEERSDSEMEQDAKPSPRRSSRRASRSRDEVHDDESSQSSSSEGEQAAPPAPKRRRKGASQRDAVPVPPARPRSAASPRKSLPAHRASGATAAATRAPRASMNPRILAAAAAGGPKPLSDVAAQARGYNDDLLQRRQRASLAAAAAVPEQPEAARVLDRTPRRPRRGSHPLGSPAPTGAARLRQQQQQVIPAEESDEDGEDYYDHDHLVDDDDTTDGVVHGEKGNGSFFTLDLWKGFQGFVLIICAAVVVTATFYPTLLPSSTTTITHNTRPCFRDYPERTQPSKIEGGTECEEPSCWWVPHCQDLPSNAAAWKPCPEDARCVSGVVSSCLVDHLTVANETECVLSETAQQTIAATQNLLLNYSVDLQCGSGKNAFYIKQDEKATEIALFDYAAVAQALQRPSDRKLLELANKASPTFLVVDQDEQTLIGLHPSVPLEIPLECWLKNTASQCAMGFLDLLWICFLLVGTYVVGAFKKAPVPTTVLLLGASMMLIRAKRKYRTKKLRLEVANLRHRACGELERHPEAIHADALIDSILDADFPTDPKRRKHLKTLIWPCVLKDWETDARIDRSWQNRELLVEWRRANHNHLNGQQQQQRVHFEE